MLYIHNVRVIGEHEIFPGAVLVKDGKIAEVGAHVPCPEGAKALDGGGQYLSPGFIDLHVHGGGGYSAMGGKDAVVRMCEEQAR